MTPSEVMKAVDMIREREHILKLLRATFAPDPALRVFASFADEDNGRAGEYWVTLHSMPIKVLLKDELHHVEAWLKTIGVDLDPPSPL